MRCVAEALPAPPPEAVARKHANLARPYGTLVCQEAQHSLPITKTHARRGDLAGNDNASLIARHHPAQEAKCSAVVPHTPVMLDAAAYSMHRGGWRRPSPSSLVHLQRRDLARAARSVHIQGRR